MKTKYFFTCLLFVVLLPFKFQAQSNSPCVDPNPVISGRDSTCPGAIDSLFVTGGTTYLWSTGATTTVISVMPTITTTYTVEAFNGTCEHDTTITINIIPAPNPIIAASKDSVCSGDTLTLEARGGTRYRWSPGGSSSKTIHITLTNPTTYTLYAFSGSCMDSTTINLGVIRPITASISASPDTICHPGSATLTVTASGGHATYLWSTGATTSSINVSPPHTTSYSVTIYGKCNSVHEFETVFDTCTTSIIEIKSTNPFALFPNPNTGVFTLQLGVSGKEYGVSKLQVEVYNVMGEKVFASCPPQTPKGALIAVNIGSQPNGIYFYRVIDESGALVGEGKFVIEK